MTTEPHAIVSAFVTGGSGYVGRNLLRTLASRGVAVRALPVVGGSPPLTRSAVRIIGPCTVVDRKARETLDYLGRTSIEAGLADRRDRARAP